MCYKMNDLKNCEVHLDQEVAGVEQTAPFLLATGNGVVIKPGTERNGINWGARLFSFSVSSVLNVY